MKKKVCRLVGSHLAACVVLLSLLLFQQKVSAQTPSFTVASGGWHVNQAPSITVTTISGTSIGWLDGQQKTASLTYTTDTGGTVSGDYNGTFNFIVRHGIAWRIEFDNGSSWEADSGEPFIVASGSWQVDQNPNITVTNVSKTSIGWLDGWQKTATLTFTSNTGGTVAGDYNGTFNFIVRHGIAWKIEFDNGSSWSAVSGEPFVVAPGSWHVNQAPSITVTDISKTSIGWLDGQQKTASLTFTTNTGGTVAGDYNGTFNFIVTEGIAWRIEFGNGSSWEADSGEPEQPRSFVIAPGGWHNNTDPNIDITDVSLYSIGWNDGQDKSGTLTYTDSVSTDGVVSGDYNGAFGFEVTNGIAWKILFGNGSSWEADSGEPAP